MLSFNKFTGINNLQPQHRLKPTDLAIATDVDIGLSGELSRRDGYSQVVDTCHKNLWQGNGFTLATVDGGDFVSFVGSAYTQLMPSLGVARVWYCNLPDGRTTFSNGSICGITDGATVTTWGVPVPQTFGIFTDIAGSMFPGSYQYQLTHVRLADGAESGAANAPASISVVSGGLVLSALPTLAGHKTNVYLSGQSGDQAYFAGSTTGSNFSFTGSNVTLTLPLRTDNLQPAPVGTVSAFWRGRVLVAVGPTLYASLPNRWELFDLRRDFKQFTANITLIQPVDGGMFVGTEKGLAFLSGTEFDKLVFSPCVEGSVVLGSGVAVRGELIKQREGGGVGAAMLCIADGIIVAGFSDGNVVRMTEGVYRTEATEVAATFRVLDGIPQYIAVPQ